MLELTLTDFLNLPTFALVIFVLFELRRIDRRIARIEGWLMRNGYNPVNDDR